MKRVQRVEEISFLKNKNGHMRPFIGNDGKAYVLNHTGGDKDVLANYEKQLVANATLRYDEWRRLDDAVIKVAEQRLIGFDDLRRNNLVYTLNNPMATTVLTWDQMSDAMEAAVSIDPIRRGDGDRPIFETKHIPIPIIHADYTIGERVLQESRTRGNGLDTLSAERATRKVLVQLEDMLFGSTSTLTYGGGTIYSYLSHPDINTVNFDSTGNWAAAGKTAANIKDDVLAMKQASIADKHYGPWMLYVPTAYETVLDDDYSVSGASGQTIKQRIEAISGIQGVKVVDRLPANTVLMVQMTSDVVDLIDGMGIQNVEWSTEGGFVHNYKVMAIQIPRIKSDYNNTSGIVKLVAA
jgi:hypothetical protein